MTFTSQPFGADVWVDGTSMGKTPLVGLELSPGAHDVRLGLSDGRQISREIRVGGRAPTRYVCKVERDAWEAGY